MARLCRIREVWVFLADGRCEEAGVCGPSLEGKDPGTCSRSHLRLPGVLWGGQAARPSLDSKAQAGVRDAASGTSLPWAGKAPTASLELSRRVAKLAEVGGGD